MRSPGITSGRTAALLLSPTPARASSHGCRRRTPLIEILRHPVAGPTAAVLRLPALGAGRRTTLRRDLFPGGSVRIVSSALVGASRYRSIARSAGRVPGGGGKP